MRDKERKRGEEWKQKVKVSSEGNEMGSESKLCISNAAYKNSTIV